MKYINSILIISFLSLVSCAEKEYGDPLEESLIISAINLNVTETLPLAIGTDSLIAYTLQPEKPTNPHLLWKSSNEAIASVSPDGKITAKALGEATIIVTPEIGFGAQTAAPVIKVQVIQEVLKAQSLVFQNMTPEIFMGDKFALTAAFTPANCTYKSLRWSSDNEAVATVSDKGIVIGIAKGTARITATTLDNSGVKVTAVVTVKEAIIVESVKLLPLEDYLGLGEQRALEYQLEPEDATVTTLQWSSDNEAVATVQNGVVTAKGFGSANITVTAPATGATSSVKVTAPAGLIRTSFVSALSPWYLKQSASYACDDEKMVVTMTQANPSKFRGDLALTESGKQGLVYFDLEKYPYLAIKMIRPSLNNAIQGNVKLDINYGAYVGTDTDTNKTANNSYKILGEAEPNTGVAAVYYYDLMNGNFEKANNGSKGTLSGSTTVDKEGSVVKLQTLQFVIADVPRNAGSTYQVYWVRSFKSLKEMQEFVNSENK